MGGPPIYKVVKNRKVPSYLHAECVKPPQNWYFFLLMRLSGAGASRLPLPFQFALRTRKHKRTPPLLLVVPWPAAKQMRLDGARGRGLPPVPLRPRQPGLAEGYGTLDQAYAG